MHHLITALSTIAIMALTTMGWREWLSIRKTGTLGEARRALKVCSQLLDLLEKLQQHRGMSSAWLAGDEGFVARMMERRLQIHALFSALEGGVAIWKRGPRKPCFTDDDCAMLRRQWLTLEGKLHGLSVEQNTAQHAHLINRVLAWLGTLGERCLELSAGDLLRAGQVCNFCHRLPLMTECLGRMRAIGSIAATQGICHPVARVRLMLLTARTEALLQQAGLDDESGAAADIARNAVEQLARVIRGSMVAGSSVTVSAEIYFALATRAIDAVYAWERDCGNALECGLTNPPRAGHADNRMFAHGNASR